MNKHPGENLGHDIAQTLPTTGQAAPLNANPEQYLSNPDQLLNPLQLRTIVVEPGVYTEGILHQAKNDGHDLPEFETHDAVLKFRDIAIERIVKPETKTEAAEFTAKKAGQITEELIPRAEVIIKSVPESEAQSRIKRGLATIENEADRLRPVHNRLRRMLDDPRTEVDPAALRSFRYEMEQFLGTYRKSTTAVSDGIFEKQARVKIVGQDTGEAAERFKSFTKQLDRRIAEVDDSQNGEYNPDTPERVEGRAADDIDSHEAECAQDVAATKTTLAETEAGLSTVSRTVGGALEIGRKSLRNVDEFPRTSSFENALDLLITNIDRMQRGDSGARAVAANALGNIKSFMTKVEETSATTRRSDQTFNDELAQVRKAIEALKTTVGSE